MHLTTVVTGAKFDVVALQRDSDSQTIMAPAIEFLVSLNAGATRGKDARPYKQMHLRLRQHAERGPLMNKQQCRPIGDDLYEFKTPVGDRLIWFYDGQVRRRTILVLGCKKRDFNQTKAAARAWKREWEQWQRTHPEA